MSSSDNEEEISTNTNTLNTSSEEEDSEDLFDAKISPRSHRPRRRPSFQVGRRCGKIRVRSTRVEEDAGTGQSQSGSEEEEVFSSQSDAGMSSRDMSPVGP